jgi:hypothetical protein
MILFNIFVGTTMMKLSTKNGSRSKIWLWSIKPKTENTIRDLIRCRRDRAWRPLRTCLFDTAVLCLRQSTAMCNPARSCFDGLNSVVIFWDDWGELRSRHTMDSLRFQIRPNRGIAAAEIYFAWCGNPIIRATVCSEFLASCRKHLTRD